MRSGMDADIIISEDGTFIGFDLSADYCAEHEWGLKLAEAFGIGNEKKFGLARRQITKLPTSKSNSIWSDPRIVDHFIVDNKTKESYLIFDYSSDIDRVKADKEHYELKATSWNKTGVGSAWDDSSFGVVTTKYHDELKELFDAFQKKDIVIGLFGGGPFKNSGLKLLIASRIPAETSKEWYNSDKDVEKLNKASAKTKIHKVLEKAGKRFMALSPSWNSTLETKYDVVYWLNPYEQQKYNYGWYTVEDLKLWAEDKGPIVEPKKK